MEVAHGPAELHRRPGRLLWEQLLDDLRRRLDADAFTGGFPGEHALVEEYGVSRHTVRQAVKVLREEGRVVGTRGRPSRQAEPVEIAQKLGALYSLHESVRALGLDQRSVVRALDVRADGVIAARLGREESTPLVYLERLRLADGEPLALDRVWLPYELASPLLEIDFSTGGLYRCYAERCGVVLTGGEETVAPILPTPAEHRLLGGSPSAAAFSIRRLGTAKGRPVEWRHTLVRGDRFVLRADFAAREGYQLELRGTPDRTDPRR
ncbi:GntR family transcriptional regulator [Pseudonocardia sp. HH130630-07]|uniref:GntR family transcriptional regulator n=1 Tax=Pseudonocardia sp. HH130630-07 TaxID=1690815 RepID=UPI00081504A6|nr:GntR family transcriptional regulator [Pseudonocardia sp. HH130630-07]ANY06544.1 GntR family transcriptional regulator [Pseudonocardia sp. HH130630-07]